MRKLMILAAAAFAVPASAATIFTEGFETPGAPFGGYAQYGGGSALGPWTVTGADVLVLHTAYAEGGLVFNAATGNNALDITGAGNTSPADGLYRDVSTVAGSTYTLTFKLGNADGTNDTRYTLPSSIGVKIDNGPSTVFTNAAQTLNGINWANQTYSFVATGTTTRVAFVNETPGPDPDNFAGLDDVVLTGSVPEPAAWGLMIGGLAMIGGAMRRRKSNTVFA